MASKPMKGRVATNDVVRVFHSGKNTFVNATKPVSDVELAPFLIPELNPITPPRPLPRPTLSTGGKKRTYKRRTYKRHHLKKRTTRK